MPRDWEAVSASGMKVGERLSPGEAVLKGLQQHEHPHDLTPELCSQLAGASMGLLPEGSRGWQGGLLGGSTVRVAAQRGAGGVLQAGGQPGTLSLSHSLSLSSLCLSAGRLATYLLSYIFSCWAFGCIPWKSVLL